METEQKAPNLATLVREWLGFRPYLSFYRIKGIIEEEYLLDIKCLAHDGCGAITSVIAKIRADDAVLWNYDGMVATAEVARTIKACDPDFLKLLEQHVNHSYAELLATQSQLIDSVSKTSCNAPDVKPADSGFKSISLIEKLKNAVLRILGIRSQKRN